MAVGQQPVGAPGGAPGGAAAVAADPGVAVPQDPRLVSAEVARSGTRMSVTVRYRIDGAAIGTVPTAWRAVAGSREAWRLGTVAHGVKPVVVSRGVYQFRARARIGAGTDRSGGFCVAPDFTAIGQPAVAVACMGGAPVARRDLVAYVPEATVFGDSVGATFDWVPGTREGAATGLSVRYDLRVCRRLIAAPCPPGPPSVLSSVRSLPGSLGDVAVINVGYNDWGATYDVGRVMRALRARGVKRVVWMTLRETQSSSRQINQRIRAAARRGGVRGLGIQVADWGAASRGRGWFGADQVHLNVAGGWGLAAFTRREIRKAVAWVRDHRDP
ncbi:MAG: hypothetical protein FJW99_05850 [Actinobacteria bacterium]|nr:hypothetical protein [Actinomycetota bacterium]MBM3697725.1 hypothetical protein [Actinomycetota bacterium]